LNPAQRRWATIERELYAASWGCEKLRCFLYAVQFLLFTDHKPPVGLFKKQGELPNTRIQQMMLAVAEYNFEVRYLPGVRNIIADYGSRQIDTTEWDKVEIDDSEGLHELMVLDQPQFEHAMYDPLYFHQSNMSSQDEEILSKLNLFDTLEIHDSLVILLHQGKLKIWLPFNSRRAFFWDRHSHLHEGSTKFLLYLRKQNILW
jgi:hypothetical protein